VARGQQDYSAAAADDFFDTEHHRDAGGSDHLVVVADSDDRSGFSAVDADSAAAAGVYAYPGQVDLDVTARSFFSAAGGDAAVAFAAVVVDFADAGAVEQAGRPELALSHLAESPLG
jgi:hypothetical protein